MSGHSKWHSIKHKKAANDAKRSKMFGQLSRDIRQAARTGNDPEKNATLREAIERAKKFNLPQGNIDRLLSKGEGELKDVTYEGYGPGGVALLINAATDNTNRTVSEVRNILKTNGGSLGEPGTVAWKFSQQAVIEVAADTDKHDDVELAAIEVGADDIQNADEALIITGEPTSLEALKSAVADAGGEISQAEVSFVAPVDQRITLDDTQQEKLDSLIGELQNHDDVLTIYHDAA